MICRELIEKLEKIYPVCLAEKWDNPGLIAGRWEKEIKRVYIALDATEETVCHAIEKKADLLLTHHPMLMQPLKKVNTGDFYGRRLISLIQNDICCYAMHTNYDIVKMAGLASEMLGLERTEVLEVTCEMPDGSSGGFGKIGNLPRKMTLAECAAYVKEVFEIPDVKVFGPLDASVYCAAVLPGSGKSMVRSAVEKHADVFISGDFGHHDGIDAVAQGLCVIDAGHYGVEHIYIRQIQEELKEKFPELELYAEPLCQPFTVL